MSVCFVYLRRTHSHSFFEIQKEKIHIICGCQCHVRLRRQLIVWHIIVDDLFFLRIPLCMNCLLKSNMKSIIGNGMRHGKVSAKIQQLLNTLKVCIQCVCRIVIVLTWNYCLGSACLLDGIWLCSGSYSMLCIGLNANKNCMQLFLCWPILLI